MDIRFDTYYRNDDLFARVRHLEEQHPAILSVRSLGTSHEGRDIPVVVVTNRETGDDLAKPALWVDANIHATEVTGSAAALYLLKKLAEGYGADDGITRLLDRAALYVVPRLNPDGAEVALADRPRFVRSGTRPFPYAERQEGLHAEDLDGDGRILQMRVEDPAGDWKVSSLDPRLMEKRGPDEDGGTYYRLLREGAVHRFDGHTIPVAPALEGLDFNRNFPGSWRPFGQQSGAGDYPGSEPEIRAVLDFYASHPNISCAVTFHTFSRVILRPFGTRKDDEIDTEDLWVMELLGERGTELSGYPCVSVYHDFRYHPKETITGVFDDWLYDHKGIFAYTVEMWDLADAAGCAAKRKDKKWIEWFRKHPKEDDEKMLAFVEEHAPGALVEWYAFEHPQLGQVELGGWERMYSWRNPPHALLEAEIAPHADFCIALANALPRLAWHAVDLEPLGEGRYALTAVVENQGFLKSCGSNRGREQKVRPVALELSLGEGVTLRAGKEREEVGHLEGRSNKLSVTSIFTVNGTDNRAVRTWLLEAPAGGEVVLQAVSERAGTLTKTITLG